MSRKMTGIVKTFDGKSGKGLITPSDGRIDVQLHVSALNLRDAEEITTGLRVEFGRNSSANNIISRLIVFRDIVLEENILNIRQITKSPAK